MNSITISLKTPLSDAAKTRIGQRLSPYASDTMCLDITQEGSAVINGKSFDGSLLEKRDGFFVVVGEINNLDAMKALAVSDSGRAPFFSNIELVDYLLTVQGKEIARYFEGAFVLIESNYKKNTISVFPGNTAQLPMFYVKGSVDYLTTEIKSVAGLADLKLRPFSDFNLQQDLGFNHNILENVDRLPSGCWSHFEEDRWIESRQTHFLNPYNGEIEMSASMAGDQFGELLFSSVSSCLKSVRNRKGIGSDIHATLSSGLDSALIVGIASRLHKSLNTCSIGTKDVNEFAGAKETAQLLGQSFFTIETERENWLNGYLDAIYYNEIYDGLSAEIQAPLASLYKALEGQANVLLSGYGADLLSGGMLKTSTPTENINPTCAESIRRTMWTLEFSPFLAKAYGINVLFPFWTTQLIQMSTAIPSKVKIANGEVKAFLRDWAVRENVLPENVAKRPKLAVHEGCGVNAYFDQLLGLEPSDGYRRKDAFSYQIYSEYLINGIPRDALSDVTLGDIIQKSRRYA